MKGHLYKYLKLQGSFQMDIKWRGHLCNLMKKQISSVNGYINSNLNWLSLRLFSSILSLSLTTMTMSSSLWFSIELTIMPREFLFLPGLQRIRSVVDYSPIPFISIIITISSRTRVRIKCPVVASGLKIIVRCNFLHI